MQFNRLGVLTLVTGLILPVTAAAALAAAKAKDVLDTASAKGCKTLSSAVKAGGLTKTLKGRGPYTLMAPNDAAFGKWPKAKLDALLADKKKLKAVLTYHVVPKKVAVADIKAPGSLKTLEGEHVITNKAGDKIWIDGAAVIEVVPCKNGMLYVIDEVLAPERGK